MMTSGGAQLPLGPGGRREGYVSPGAALETAWTLASQGVAGPWPSLVLRLRLLVEALNWGGLEMDVLRGRARLEVSLPFLVALKCLYFLKNVSITSGSKANILGVCFTNYILTSIPKLKFHQTVFPLIF